MTRVAPIVRADELDAERTVDTGRSTRPAVVVFAAVLGVAFVLFLAFGHSQWFFLDEWDFLAGRRALDLGDLLRPHNEHWSTLPILVYRSLWTVFGLRTYVPYQLVTILLHLTAAALLWMVMRRAGVGAWVATAAASLFALFGTGNQDIIWAFQMGWGASLVLGLTHLMLADHDGPIDRRDGLGLLAGVAGMLCSGVAVTMIVVVGLCALLRRGWRVALFHTAPLGLLYLVWWFAFARTHYASAHGSISLVAQFTWNGLAETFDAMGQVRELGFALAALLVVGLVLAWRGLPVGELRKRAAAPASMLVGSVVFLGIAGVGRASVVGPELARASRYLHIVAALSLPCIAVAVDAFVRRSRVLGFAALALILVGIPGNIDALVNRDTRLQTGSRNLALATPRSRLFEQAPRRLHPLPEAAPEVTVGWLRDGVAKGQFPLVERVDPRAAVNASLRLSVLQSPGRPVTSGCRPLRRPVTLTVERGQAIGIDGGRIRVSLASSPFASVLYSPEAGHTLVALHGPLKLSMASATPIGPFIAILCG